LPLWLKDNLISVSTNLLKNDMYVLGHLEKIAFSPDSGVAAKILTAGIHRSISRIKT